MWAVYTFDSVLEPVYDPHKSVIVVTFNKQYAIIDYALFTMHNIYIQSSDFNLND